MAEYGKPGVTWDSEIIVCKGGLTLDTDALTQGSTMQGTAKTLQNFECALEGGYRRINGYTKWDSAQVPGHTGTEIYGVKVALNGVFAARMNNAQTSVDIFYSTKSGWGSRINSDTRAGTPVNSKVRMITYTINKPVVAGVDGNNYAWKYDGATYTLLNGTGAPTNPQFLEMFNASLVLAGYSANPQNLIITAPNTDTDFAAADGAIEINVGDTITGLKNFRNSLYVFCTNRIFKIVPDPQTVYDVQIVTTQVGCVASDTIQEVAGDLIYLAPDGFRSVAGTFNIGDVDLSLQSRKIQPIIRNSILADIPSQQFSSCVIRAKSQYRCVFHNNTVDRASTLGVIGKVEQGQYLSGFNQTFTEYSWSTTLGLQCHSMDSYWDNSVETVVMGDQTTGYVYQLESGNDFDGTPIQAVYSSPFLTFKDASLRKVMQKANIYAEIEGVNSVNLNLLFDFQNTGVLQPNAQVLTFTGNFPTYGIAVYGTDMYASVQFPVFKQNLIGSGFTTAFQFTSDGGAPYRIDSMQIIYAQKGRR